MDTSTRRSNRAQRDFLSRCALFCALPEARLDELDRASRLIEYPGHALLYRSGEPVREALLLCAGSVVRVRMLGEDSQKVIEVVQTPQLLNLGETFGAAQYQSSCETLSRCIVVAIALPALRALIAAEPAFSLALIDALARRQAAIETDSRTHHRSTTGAQRILDYLLEQAGDQAGLAGETTVTLKASKKVIASHIGLTPEAFSRSLRQLVDQGALVVEKRNFHLQHAALLDTGPGDSHHRLRFARKSRGARQADSLTPGGLVNLCGRLRVLSQRMALAWARQAWALAPAEAATRLRQCDHDFSRTLARLQAVPAPLRAALQRIEQRWPAYRAALLAEDRPSDMADEILRASEDMLTAAHELTCLAEQYVGTRDAHYVNIAGRNRMLSQRIGKLFLFRELVAEREAPEALLDTSIAEFEANLGELGENRDRLPELAAQLGEVSAQWGRFRRALEPDPSRGSRVQSARLLLAEGERLLRYVDTTVKLYERLTK